MLLETSDIGKFNTSRKFDNVKYSDLDEKWKSLIINIFIHIWIWFTFSLSCFLCRQGWQLASAGSWSFRITFHSMLSFCHLAVEIAYLISFSVKSSLMGVQTMFSIVLQYRIALSTWCLAPTLCRLQLNINGQQPLHTIADYGSHKVCKISRFCDILYYLCLSPGPLSIIKIIAKWHI